MWNSCVNHTEIHAWFECMNLNVVVHVICFGYDEHVNEIVINWWTKWLTYEWLM